MQDVAATTAPDVWGFTLKQVEALGTAGAVCVMVAAMIFLGWKFIIGPLIARGDAAAVVTKDLGEACKTAAECNKDAAEANARAAESHRLAAEAARATAEVLRDQNRQINDLVLSIARAKGN